MSRIAADENLFIYCPQLLFFSYTVLNFFIRTAFFRTALLPALSAALTSAAAGT